MTLSKKKEDLLNKFLDDYKNNKGIVSTINFLFQNDFTIDEIKCLGFNENDIDFVSPVECDKVVGALDRNNIVEDEYIYFGSYPQSEVTDEALKTALNAKAGALPTEGNIHKFTSYGYYIGTGKNNSVRVSDYMWFIDVKYRCEKYRGVYFTSYRPAWCDDSSLVYNNNRQGKNGYKTRNLYWFKYEPIKWRILTESNGKAMLLADLILDSQQYDYKEDGSSSNNYANSTIRSWLNYTFYNTAFNAEEQAKILTTVVDNSARSTNPNNDATEENNGYNYYACANTNDKVFLLSKQEVTNSAYGFDSDCDAYDTARQKKTSAYAQCQGVWISTDYYKRNGFWQLRSPYCYGSHLSHYINGAGSSDSSDYVGRTDAGVVPALRVKLNSTLESTTNDSIIPDKVTTSTETHHIDLINHSIDIIIAGDDVNVSVNKKYN